MRRRRRSKETICRESNLEATCFKQDPVMLKVGFEIGFRNEIGVESTRMCERNFGQRNEDDRKSERNQESKQKDRFDWECGCKEWKEQHTGTIDRTKRNLKKEEE